MPRLHTLDQLISFRDYRLLWTGNSCSNTAQWFQLLTIVWLVRDLTVGSSTSILQSVAVGGLLLAVTCVGGFISTVILASVGFTFEKGSVALASIVFSSIFVILFAWSYRMDSILPMFSLFPALAFIGLMSLVQTNYRITSETLIQLITPDRYRSRVTSFAGYDQGFVYTFSIVVGVLVGLKGVVTTITVLGIAGFILSLYFTIKLDEVRQQPGSF